MTMTDNRAAQQSYIASCVFTARYQELSLKIQKYIAAYGDINIVRCCVPNYRLRDFEEKMSLPEGLAAWQALPDSAAFQAGDTVYSLCHNCSAVIEEWRQNVNIKSLWELIDNDVSFAMPDYGQYAITLQDCWRARGRTDEQRAVRRLLHKMNVKVCELPEQPDETEFCGISLLRPAPVRNLKLAPKRFVDGAVGKFKPHTPAEQQAAMQEYCRRFTTPAVVAYCHYCTEGLELGGVNTFHLAELLFEPEKVKARL